MLLSEFVPIYCLARDLSPRHQQNLRLAVDAFTRFAGQVEITNLCDDLLNRWLVELANDGKARWTIKNARASILALWRAAVAEGLTTVEPKRVRTIAIPRTLPEAWDLAQLRMLLAASQAFGGHFKLLPVKRAAYWRAFILTAYDTGLRLLDLERIRTEQVGDGGALAITQNKTGWPILCHLRPETIAAIRATYPPERPLLFGGVLKRRHLYTHWSALVAKAGLSGGTRKLRKTSATWVEAVSPGSAMAHLGHRTPGLAYAHYVDRRLLNQNRPMPPSITG